MASFATEVKNELARLSVEKETDRTAELAGLLRMSAAILFGQYGRFGVNFTSKNAAVSRKALQLFKQVEPGMRTEIAVSRSRQFNKHNQYGVRVVPSLEGTNLLEKLGFLQGGSLSIEPNGKLLRGTSSRVAYLRGAFLGGGSVNRPEASYHLEMVTGNYAFGKFLYDILRRMAFPVGMTERKDGYLVYIKEGDAIVDFLGMLGADAAVEAFEVARNVKEVRGQVNRLVNCETANLQKSVDAAGRQIEAIRTLKRHGLYEELPPKLKKAAQMRLQHPDASLLEIAEMLDIGKSGVNHRFRKIQDLAGRAEAQARES